MDNDYKALNLSKSKQIYTIGLSGFPYGTAASSKLLLMCRALVEKDQKCTVVSNIYVKKNDLNKLLEKEGIYKDIRYLTTSPYVFRPEKGFRRAIAKVTGKFKEFVFLIKKSINHEIDVVFIYSFRFIYTFLYTILLRLLGCKVYLIYFELRHALSHRTKYKHRINDYLFDFYAIRTVNGVILISNILISHLKSIVPRKPYIKIPPLVDFNEFEQISGEVSYEYFLYCGTLAYKDVIDFIVESYFSINIQHQLKLVLIVSGNENEKKKLSEKYSKYDEGRNIEVKGNLSYQDLVVYYKNARALLIPVRDTLQDTARFPQKIAEYCASGRPIITTCFGEITNYLEDDYSALIAQKYDVINFSEKMEKVIKNPEMSEKTAKNAYQTGLKHFNYKKYSNDLIDFINSAQK